MDSQNKVSCLVSIHIHEINIFYPSGYKVQLLNLKTFAHGTWRRFLKIEKLKKLDAKSLYDCLKTCLHGDPDQPELKIEVDRVVGLGVDGASVMSGEINGMAAIIKIDSKGCIHVHCIAHRFQLAVSQAAEGWEQLNEGIEDLLSRLHTYFGSNPVRNESLRAWQEKMQEPHRNVLRHVPTRWLSRRQVVNNLMSIITSVINCLAEQQKKKDKAARQLYEDLTIFSTLALLFHLNDILDELHTVAKFFQRSDISFSEIKPMVDGLISNLETKYLDTAAPQEQKFGAKYREFISKLGPHFKCTPVGGKFDFAGQRCTKDDTETMLATILSDYVSKLVENLKARFPAEYLTFWDNASIIDPVTLFVDEEEPPAGHGDNRFYHLVRHFKHNLERSGIAVPTSEAEIKRQWTSFVPYFRRHYMEASKEWKEMKKKLEAAASSSAASTAPKYSKMVLTWRRVLSSETLRSLFPLVLAVAVRVLVIPVSSVDCERGFSQQNLIRTKHRTRLLIQTLDSLMRVAMNGPTFKSLTDKFSLKVFLAWKGARGYRYLLSKRKGAKSGTKYHMTKTGGDDILNKELGYSLPVLDDGTNSGLPVDEDADDLAALQAKQDAFGYDDF